MAGDVLRRLDGPVEPGGPHHQLGDLQGVDVLGQPGGVLQPHLLRGQTTMLQYCEGYYTEDTVIRPG